MSSLLFPFRPADAPLFTCRQAGRSVNMTKQASLEVDADPFGKPLSAEAAQLVADVRRQISQPIGANVSNIRVDGKQFECGFSSTATSTSTASC